MSQIIEKYRKEAWDHFNNEYKRVPTWREAILESIFRPEMRDPPGKSPMSHLHPDIHKLHLPPNMYLADWRKYQVEDHPALVKFQKRCHAAGLHDPWLRNYAWQFYSNRYECRSRLAIVTKGLTFGLVAATILSTGKAIYLHYYPIEYAHSPEYIAKYGNQEVFH